MYVLGHKLESWCVRWSEPIWRLSKLFRHALTFVSGLLMRSGSCKVVTDLTASTCCERGEWKKEGRGGISSSICSTNQNAPILSNVEEMSPLPVPNCDVCEPIVVWHTCVKIFIGWKLASTLWRTKDTRKLLFTWQWGSASCQTSRKFGSKWGEIESFERHSSACFFFLEHMGLSQVLPQYKHKLNKIVIYCYIYILIAVVYSIQQLSVSVRAKYMISARWCAKDVHLR